MEQLRQLFNEYRTHSNNIVQTVRELPMHKKVMCGAIGLCITSTLGAIPSAIMLGLDPQNQAASTAMITLGSIAATTLLLISFAWCINNLDEDDDDELAADAHQEWVTGEQPQPPR